MKNTKSVKLVLSLVLLGFSLFLAADTGQKPSSYNSNVSEVVDGDTVDFEGGFTGTVRLLGVDTPETQAANAPEEFGLEDTRENRNCLEKKGVKATEFTENYTSGDKILISVDPASDRRGDYGRLLAYIHAESSSESLNRLLLEKGLARVYVSDFRKLKAYQEVEKIAREKDIGVWSC